MGADNPKHELQKLTGGTKKLGSYFIDSNQAVTWGDYEYLVVNAECVFTVLQTISSRNLLAAHAVDDGFGDGLNLSGATVAKGIVIYPPLSPRSGNAGSNDDNILNVTLSSGSVIAYG